jgi:hypothetical protein
MALDGFLAEGLEDGVLLEEVEALGLEVVGKRAVFLVFIVDSPPAPGTAVLRCRRVRTVLRRILRSILE